jgi:hypothetical protein
LLKNKEELKLISEEESKIILDVELFKVNNIDNIT